MAKRKITVTVDEGLVEAVQAIGTESVSAVVNAALAAELDRRGRAAALARLLQDWEERYGPVDDASAAAATAAFDDVDGVAEPRPADARLRRRATA
jgi:post-segregation antitoxin (ccd killing protein)